MEDYKDPNPPDKCPKCGCKETKMADIYYGNPGEVHEYALRCKNCNELLAYWAYGSWID